MAYTYATLTAAIAAATDNTAILAIKTQITTDMAERFSPAATTAVNRELDQISIEKDYRTNFFFLNNAAAIFAQYGALLPLNATGYREYVALLSQSGTAAPVIRVLSNNLGAIAIGYTDVGYYEVTSDGLFTVDKTVIEMSNPRLTALTGYYFAGSFYYDDDSEFAITTAKQQTIELASSLVAADGVLYNTMIRIRVYN